MKVSAITKTSGLKFVYQVGQVFTHPTLGNVKIIAVHPLGTIDVQNIFTGNCYRISGLPI